ncbi:MAG: hypothetical protein ACO295_03290 [Sediminibacterium sp.]
MSNTYKDKKVAHVQGLRRSGASGFHSPRGYKRKNKYPDKDLQYIKNKDRIKYE